MSSNLWSDGDETKVEDRTKAGPAHSFLKPV